MPCKKGLVPPHQLQTAPARLKLLTASGSALPGGNEQTVCELEIEGLDSVAWERVTGKFQTTFLVADIWVDAILSFGWLYQHGLAIHPRAHGLAYEENPLIFYPGCNLTPASLSKIVGQVLEKRYQQQTRETNCPPGKRIHPRGRM